MSSAPRLARSAAIACLILATVPGYYAVTLPWTHGVDFDLTGFFWLIGNLPRLFAFALTAVFVGAAASFAIRATRL